MHLKLLFHQQGPNRYFELWFYLNLNTIKRNKNAKIAMSCDAFYMYYIITAPFIKAIAFEIHFGDGNLLMGYRLSIFIALNFYWSIFSYFFFSHSPTMSHPDSTDLLRSHQRSQWRVDDDLVPGGDSSQRAPPPGSHLLKRRQVHQRRNHHRIRHPTPRHTRGKHLRQGREDLHQVCSTTQFLFHFTFNTHKRS